MTPRRREASIPGARESRIAVKRTASMLRPGWISQFQAISFLFILAIAYLAPHVLVCQVQNGTITGTVADPTGSVVQGSNVTLTQKSTSLTFHGQTNNSGVYSLPQLFVCPWKVSDVDFW